MALLLVDFANLFYKGFHIHQQLSFSGRSTGGLYGFATQLANTILQVQPDRVVICCDCKPYLRSEDFPEYKTGRIKIEDRERASAVRDNRGMSFRFLDHLGLQPLRIRGLEADDVVAILCKKHQHEDVVIASNDSDLFQLLDQKNLRIYRGAKRGFYGSRDLFKEYPHLPNARSWAKVLAMSGGHNSLQGIRGVGPATAVKILTVPSMQRRFKDRLDENQELVDHNLKIVKLPYHRISDWQRRQVKVPRYGKYDEQSLREFLASFGITFTAPMRQAFDHIHQK